MDVRVEFDGSMLNIGSVIRLCRPHPFYALFLQYFIAFCRRPEEASDAITGRLVGLTVADKSTIS